jgi:hypothetical protein
MLPRAKAKQPDKQPYRCFIAPEYQRDFSHHQSLFKNNLTRFRAKIHAISN